MTIMAGLAIAGAGMQFHASQQAAKSQSALAVLNAQNANLAAKQNYDLQMLNTQMESRRAEVQAEAQRLQGKNLEAEADLADKAAMENVARSREEMNRFRAIQRARIAGSGVVESGTPLDALAESAGDMELALASSFYTDTQKGREMRYEAGMVGAGAALLATDAAMMRTRGGFAKSAYTAEVSQNNVTRLAGQAQARITRMQGVGNLLSSVSSAASSYGNMQQNRPKGS